MTVLLANIAGAAEAEAALAHGADVLHVADGSAAAATVAIVAGRAPVSAAAGAAEPDAVSELADAGADIIEVELPAGPDQADRIRALAGVSRRAKLAGILVAGQPIHAALFAVMADSGFHGVMLDTAQRNARLLGHHDIAALGDIVDAAHAHRLAVGLAGAIEAPDVPRLLLLRPDVIAVRTMPFSAARLDMVRGLVPRTSPDGRPPVLDLRRRTRGQEGRSEATDRVFVRDFVLPARIGAYAREHDLTQKVRFDVEVRVLRQSHPAEHMSDVFSYDIITDSIRMILREHIALVETLAERIAAVLLAHPRVTSATVRVEKLDMGPAGVGVEITRDKPAEAASVVPLPRSGP